MIYGLLIILGLFALWIGNKFANEWEKVKSEEWG